MLDILNQIGRASRLFAKETGLPDMLVGLVMVSAELLLLFSALVFVPRWMYWLCRKAGNPTPSSRWVCPPPSSDRVRRPFRLPCEPIGVP